MKYLSVVVVLAALAVLSAGCGGSGTVGGGSRLLVSREPIVGGERNTDIYLLSSTGETLERVVGDLKTEIAPRWSPDGSRIAFIRINSSSIFQVDQAIHVVNADGTSEQNLDPGELAVADIPQEPAWLDNNTLVFRRGTGAPAGLVKRTVGSVEVTVLTTPGPDSTDEFPAVSPDGSKIAFIRTTTTSGSTSSSALYVANADGTDAHSLLTNVERAAPAWSPDGTKLAFVRMADFNWELYVAAADGTNLQRLTDSSGRDFSPVWSPDGSKLAFASDREDSHDEVYLMNSDGTEQIRLTNNDASSIPYGWK